MSYYRLRDIKTPPFAYVLNREEAVQTCRGCQLPMSQLASPLQVEICVNQPATWQDKLAGQPMMADHWLIGDAEFGARLAHLLGGHVANSKVEIATWLTSEPSFGKPRVGSNSQSQAPAYFHFYPEARINWAEEVLNQFPPISCQTCRRKIPNIPFHFQPAPSLANPIPFTALRDFHLDGYDYLFHSSITHQLIELFPNMVLEKLSEPSFV